MTSQYQIKINARVITLDAGLHPLNETLLQTLHRLGLLGSKEGCGDGDCGACTIACKGVDGKLRAINSCLVPTAQLAGQTVLTAEGIAHAVQLDAHPVQRAMVDCAGSQCGYCTPGFVMSLFADYHNQELNDQSVEGNLCRCTGYVSIRRAINKLANQQAEPLLTEKPTIYPATQLQGDQQSMFRPADLREALALKAANPNAQWLAGGTDLGLAFSRYGGASAHICVDHLPELRQLKLEAASLEIGAAVPLADIAELLHAQASQLPSCLLGLQTMLLVFAAKQVRNRATLGGNLGTASPIGDLLPVLLALNAVVSLASVAGTRLVPADSYFKSYRQTAKNDDELVLAIRIPLTAHLSQSYKVGKRGSDDISIVSACFALDMDANRVIRDARLAFGGIAATPVRATQVEQMLQSQTLSAELLAEALNMLRSSFTPLSDFRGSAGYRNTLVANLFEKFTYDFELQQKVALS